MKTVHKIIAYLKYRWKAKNRHGTHSPFVYDFVENVVETKNIALNPDLPENLGQKDKQLLSKIIARYGYKAIAEPTYGGDKCDVLLLTEIAPQEWITALEQHVGLIDVNGMVFIAGIHNSVAHTAAWNKIIAHAQVRMSIDLYSAGILLFRKEFRENQQFILRN
jgi:hypothetical protein